MSRNPQDHNSEDLQHALANGVTFPQLAARSLIPPHTLACIMGRDTLDGLGGQDAELRDLPGLCRVLGGFGE